MWGKRNLNELQQILSDVSDPVFIVTENRRISLANEAARRGCHGTDPSGKLLNDLVYFVEKETFADEKIGFSPAWFSNEWLEVASTPFRWGGTNYTKVILKKRKRVPSQDTLLTVQNMIAVLLNRLRSPLTGLQGYTGLIREDQDPTSLIVTARGAFSAARAADAKPPDPTPVDGKAVGAKPPDHTPDDGKQADDGKSVEVHSSGPTEDDLKSEICSEREERTPDQKQAWYSRVHDGVQQLFDILDDLEVFHHGLNRPGDSTSSLHSWPEEIIERVLLDFTPEERKRVRYTSSAPRSPLTCHPSVLETIVSILIENALENAPESEILITLESPETNCIRISNPGPVIPDEILDYLYFPFVTGRSNKLGLGLTMAQIIATHHGALLYLSENSLEKGVIFTLRTPPTRKR